VAGDEENRIDALREEMLKEIEMVRGDIKSLKTWQNVVLVGLGLFLALCSLIIGALALSANIF
jgi:hypothetical protein